jgi:hypothetical protein
LSLESGTEVTAWLAKQDSTASGNILLANNDGPGLFLFNSGNSKVGMGDKFAEGKMLSFAPGSFAYLGPDIDYYAMAEGEAIVQVHAMSPTAISLRESGGRPRQEVNWEATVRS